MNPVQKKNNRYARCAVEVLINDCPVEFKLDRDKNISDIIDSISEWTRERDLIFYELYINDDLYSIDKLPKIDRDDIQVINCIVQSKADVVFSSADEAARYCDRVMMFIKHVLESGEWNRNDIDDLINGISWLLEVLDKVLMLLAIDKSGLKYKDRDIGYHFHLVEEFRDSMIAAADDSKVRELIALHKDIFSDIKYIFRIILLSDAMRSLIIQSIDSPDVLISSLRSAKEELSGQLANMQAAAISYQTGKDVEGSQRLKDFIDFIYRYTRTCHQIVPVFHIDLSEVEVDGISLEKKNRDLRNFLHELMTIMENNDIISLSDSLEYEILPAMRNLDVYIDELLKRIIRK